MNTDQDDEEGAVARRRDEALQRALNMAGVRLSPRLRRTGKGARTKSGLLVHGLR